uniref:KAT8 regulatory NSL complex subunit 1 like n=1 Tax=Leptobrachium leishanense TaxID=445787 RepID=A0A8C5MAH4_9ANUR
MTPALTETASQGPEVHFCPSLAFQSLSPDDHLCADNSKTVEQIGPSEANHSTVEYMDAKCFQTSLDHLGSQTSSINYPTAFLFMSSVDVCLQNKINPAFKVQEWNSCSRRFPSKMDTHPLLSIMTYQPERKVKRALFPGDTIHHLADVSNTWDRIVTEDQGTHRGPHLNCMANGKKEDLLPYPQSSGHPVQDLLCLSTHAGSMPDKESQLNTGLLDCLKRQQVLLNRAKRTQKRLQSLLAHNATELCSEQIKRFLDCQTQVTEEPSTSVQIHDRDTGIPAANSSNVLRHCNIKNGISRPMSSALRQLSVSATSILEHIEQQLDSDATEYSSDEEWDESPPQSHHGCDIEWNWLSHRAGIGSRWAWLQAQISELEYKIQQLADIHAQIRKTKGTVTLEEHSRGIYRREPGLPDPCTLLSPVGRLPAPTLGTNLSPTMDLEMSPSSPTLLLRNIEKQSAQLTEMVHSLIVHGSISPMESPKSKGNKRSANGFPYRATRPHDKASQYPNGFCGQQQTKRRKNSAKASSAIRSNFSGSARTRPLKAFHKRRLYKPNLYSPPENTAMLLNEMVFPDEESLLNTYYGSTIASWDRPERFGSLSRNVCAVDPYFHPVLSLPFEIPLHLHLESLLKSNDIKGEAPTNALLQDQEDSYADYASTSWNNGHKPSCKPQMRYEMRRRERRHTSDSESVDMTIPCDSLKNVTQVGSAASSAQKPSAQRFLMRDSSGVFGSSRRRLRSENSYDIDNIVIPMSLVAPAKVEKLQYKEILTPRWKLVVLQPLEVTPDEELEDLSDEAYVIRHETNEVKEKARWSLWEQSKWSKRSRSSSNGLCVWSGSGLPSADHGSSPHALLAPHDVHSADPECPQCIEEYSQDQVEQWECRVFPLTETTARSLLREVDKDAQCTSAPHSPSGDQQLGLLGDTGQT